MIVSVEEIMKRPEFKGQYSDVVREKLEALEMTVREYTHNNFQNRSIRFIASSEGNILNGTSPFLRVGDTIQISQSLVNDGLYVVTELCSGYIKVDKELFEVPYNLVTKVEYPASVKTGVIDLMIWKETTKNKIGIKSETLSRHTVTYYDQDSNNQINGYPVSLLGFLEPYKKARF
jgi:hypothetical protein